MAAGFAPPTLTEHDDQLGLYLPDRTPKKDTRSKLLRSKEAAAGLVVNACPFGCREEDLDATAYCKHLVGFTDPADEEQYFPVKLRPLPEKAPRNATPFRFTDGTDPQMVEGADRLVKISDAAGSRVYRPKPGPVPVYVDPDAPKPAAS